jgi:hypothetical protein
MFNKSNLLSFAQDGHPVIFDADTGVVYALTTAWPDGSYEEEAIKERTLTDCVVVRHPSDDPSYDPPLRFTGPCATALWNFLASRATHLLVMNDDDTPIKQHCEARYDSET